MALEHQSGDLQTFLRDFHKDPSTVINQLPPKVGDETNLDNTNNPLGQKPLDLRTVVEIKDSFRSGLCKEVNGLQVCLGTPEGRAEIEKNDQAINLIDTVSEACGGNGFTREQYWECVKNSKHVFKLSEMDKQNLHSASLPTQPWSDDYWAIANGILSHRYGHVEKTEEMEWDVAFETFWQTPPANFVEQVGIDQLSPAEKYDLLVGDKNFTLTNAMWAEGKNYFDRNGSVETWMGICHGWAAAAYMLDRPAKAITVKSADGSQNITFYPSDVKALASLLWAKNQYPSKFVGGRCNTKDPARDENGRVTDQECFDNNPGTWHLSVVNQIAKAKRSFIMDATFDYEVWNQPVVSYQYRYFNLVTGEPSFEWSKSAITKEHYKNSTNRKDIFSSYRAADTVKLVGVEMIVTYVVETDPVQSLTDTPAEDGLTSVTYRYDLELNAKDEIIGGEWYTNAHPDFLWTPTKKAKALGQVDQYLKSANAPKWNTSQALPAIYQQVAPYASRRGTPLSAIVSGLVKKASK